MQLYIIMFEAKALHVQLHFTNFLYIISTHIPILFNNNCFSSFYSAAFSATTTELESTYIAGEYVATIWV